jgi:hypothetical protein
MKRLLIASGGLLIALAFAWAAGAAPEPTASTTPAAKGEPAAEAKAPDAKAADAKAADAKTADAKTGPAKSMRPPTESLMFSTDELNEIRGRLASGAETETQAKAQAIEDAGLYLSTIVYYGPKDWTIWVNGVPIGPNQEFQSFQVTDINANSVQLLVPLSAQGMRPVRLSPNQTFITKTGAVVEGRMP